MLKNNPFQMKRTIHPESYSIGKKIVLAVIVIIASQATVGQWIIDTRAPVSITPSGARTSIRYGATNTFRAKTRLLPSEHRYDTRGKGLLPSEVRYSSFAPGLLPSERRTAYSAPSSSFAFRQSHAKPYAALGSVRYGTRSRFTPVYAQPRPSPAVAYARPSPKPLVSMKTRTANILYAAQGTIRYGTTNTSFSKMLITQKKGLSKSGQKSSLTSPKGVTTADASKLKPDLLITPGLQGSIRYGSVNQTMPKTTRQGFIPKI